MMATTMIATHKVEDFAKWKQGFEAGEEMRSQVGITIKGIYQSVEDENTVTIISQVSNAEMAMALFESPEMKEAMQKGGVISKPELLILKQI